MIKVFSFLYLGTRYFFDPFFSGKPFTSAVPATGLLSFGFACNTVTALVFFFDLSKTMIIVVAQVTCALSAVISMVFMGSYDKSYSLSSRSWKRGLVTFLYYVLTFYLVVTFMPPLGRT